MKILQLTGEPILNGGQESFIINVVKNMNMEGIDIDILTPYYCDNNFYKEIIEAQSGNVYSLNCKFNPGSFRWNIVYPLYTFLRINHYDVIHIHSGSTTVLALASLIAKLSGIKKIIVHSHCTGRVKDMKYYLLKLSTFPFLRYIPNYYCACSKEAGLWKFPKFIVNKRLKIIKNGIDLNLFKPELDVRNSMRLKLNISDHTLVVGHVGRFTIEKNHKFIIKVFSKLCSIVNDSKLLLVGDGELLQNMRNLVKDLNIEDKVIFTGNVSDVYNYMQVMDVFLFPSFWEGLGMVAIEAQGVGIPVIASKNVPREMKLTDEVTFLDSNIDVWIKQILKFSKLKRKYNAKYIQNAGYAITLTSQELRNIYMS